jgi:putative peptidoglycan lipid II flippase
MTSDANNTIASQPTGRLRWLHPSHRHTVFSATLLLMISASLSRVIGLVREKYIAYIFGAGGQTDAYRAAFQLPDMINYFLVGGVASVVFVSILGRYREQGREQEGERALSAILSMMLVVLSAGILLAEFFARYYVAWWFDGFSPEKITLTTQMTRILLPAQLFFFTGGVLASVLIVRKQFAYQAVSPLLYNIFIILGGVLLAGRIGVPSLAIGALVGAFTGMCLLNYVGVRRAGVQIHLTLNWGHPGLREWVKLSLPLMLGVSLVTFDTWIINHLASHGNGEIARLNFAKALFTAPMAVLGQAAGAASMPFFAALIGQGKRSEFAAQVNGSVTRIIAISLLGSAWMIGLARSIVVVLLRGGALHQNDALMIAKYFAIFAVSLFLWSSQSIYARAFYAAGNTLTPMVAGTVITVLSLPVYWGLYHAHGATGLAIASDIGIFTQTMAMAVLLHLSGLIRINGLDWKEIARSLAAALAAIGSLYALVRVMPQWTGYLGALLYLTVGSLLWLAICWAVLHFTGSKLPEQLTGRLFKRGRFAETAV